MTQLLAERKILTKPSQVAKPPEIELLLCCSRTSIDSARAERIESLLRQEIDWDYLTNTAARHGVMPLLYQSLNGTCPGAVPEAILNQLKKDFRTNAIRNLHLSKELLKLLDLFAAHNIPVLCFKGPVLAASIYGDLSLRQFSDIDILVSESNILEARDLLVSQNAKMRFHVIEPTEGEEEAFIQSRTVHQFVREAAYEFEYNQGKVIVELHWEVIPKYFCFPLKVKHLREHLESVSILDRTVPNLAPEDSLLLLCGHGTKDCWDKLARVCDIAELLRSYPQLDWGRVLKQARQRGGERILLHGLLLAHNLLGATLPEQVWQRIQCDPKIAAIASQAQEWLFCPIDERPGRVEQFFFHLRTKERLRDKVGFALSLALTPTPSDWALFPRSAFPSVYYYLLRPLRMLVNWGLKKF
ncbi:MULTISPECIES: nucleotidyltransferase family protein [unclassified Coleofasciculus]|uniref:nucleotidyltransferase domain-containing protein n=1 Tax=unclassified Coleofasciculus TaxID=2692782 RepID=UPI00188053CA|nr:MULTISPECIES: nucleotidyltransferase family protein [unclassified Coleofasciculus]MBE9125528.1 nucleotidyltransferase family protein [Coleofasciculus sp. LEGE 07081]MBE9148608.1 nucleotidyltransferase family protein [Coleofasciculus sp. LEGE 07092]